VHWKTLSKIYPDTAINLADHGTENSDYLSRTWTFDKGTCLEPPYIGAMALRDLPVVVYIRAASFGRRRKFASKTANLARVLRQKILPSRIVNHRYLLDLAPAQRDEKSCLPFFDKRHR
jgi:hypothetical protein